MPRMMHTLPLTCAATALLVFSAPASAQTSTTTRTTTASSQVTTTTTENAGQALMDARKSLNAVLNMPAPNKEMFEKLNDIKTHYLELEKAYSARGDWKSHHAAILQRIGELVDSPTATGSASTATAVTGATGTSGKTAPAKLDAAAINSLQAFRKALNDFATAMSGVSASATTTASSAAAPAATATATVNPPAASATTPPAATASATAPPAAAPSVTAPPAATATAAAAATVDPDPHVAEIARLIGVALSSTATTPGADTVCVDKKTLQDIQTHIQQMQAVKKPQ